MHARTSPRRDDGFAMYTVIMVMMVILVLAASMANGSVATITGVNKDEVATRAFQAAEAGLQTALHRVNLIQPATSQCVTTVATAPQSGSNWCTATSPESIGNGQTFTYQTSTVMSTGCTGSTFGTSTSERCVVATGTVAGVSRRVIARIVSATGSSPFPVAGVLGINSMTIGQNAQVKGAVGSNGLITMTGAPSVKVTGNAQIWTNAPAPNNVGAIAGGVVRGAQYTVSRPNMINPNTGLDSATSNDNARLLAGASPADTCTTSGGCYTNTAASPRYLNFSGGKAVTLGGGVYNFCRVNFFSSSTLNIATTARVIIFLDSPDRPGSGCAQPPASSFTGGQWDQNDNGRTSSPDGDPSRLEVVAYGSSKNPLLKFDNNSLFVGAMYAPYSDTHFYNNSTVNGGVTAAQFEIDDNATTYDSRIANLHFATTLIYFRGTWRQCNSLAQSATAPATGCM